MDRPADDGRFWVDLLLLQSTRQLLDGLADAVAERALVGFEQPQLLVRLVACVLVAVDKVGLGFPFWMALENRMFDLQPAVIEVNKVVGFVLAILKAAPNGLVHLSRREVLDEEGNVLRSNDHLRCRSEEHVVELQLKSVVGKAVDQGIETTIVRL